jgi:hypothetical protein
MFGIVVCKNSINLGDEIQSLAAIKQLRKNGIEPSFYYDRDTGDLYSYENHEILIPDPKKKYNLICNGWFDGEYCNWPIVDYINILFISFHVNETKKDNTYNWLDKYKKEFESLTSIKYKDFYKNKNIGCRDEHSFNKFIESGYKAYISGCLTMTLDISKEERTEIYLVDVYPSEIYKFVPKDILDKSKFITHIFKGENCTDEELKYKQAENILNLYKKAKLVITCRLHVALPCLAYDTPVLFYYHNMKDVRLVGLIDTIPVIGRDDINFNDFKNIKPACWDERVINMNKTISDWIKDS